MQVFSGCINNSSAPESQRSFELPVLLLVCRWVTSYIWMWNPSLFRDFWIYPNAERDTFTKFSDFSWQYRQTVFYFSGHSAKNDLLVPTRLVWGVQLLIESKHPKVRVICRHKHGRVGSVWTWCVHWQERSQVWMLILIVHIQDRSMRVGSLPPGSVEGLELLYCFFSNPIESYL